MTGQIEKRPYGTTVERVTAIGLGGASLAQLSLADGVSTVRRALDLGVTNFDTAPAYGHGASQVIVGVGLDGTTPDHLLATKLGYMSTPEAFRSEDSLRAQLWENLRALRRDQVDVLQVHLAERACWWSDGASPDELVSLEFDYDFENAPVMRVLREAKTSGLCRYIGITADRADELAHILKRVDVDSCLVAYDYNLLNRQARRKALPMARKKGVAYVAAGIFKPHVIEVHPEWLTARPDGMD